MIWLRSAIIAIVALFSVASSAQQYQTSQPGFRPGFQFINGVNSFPLTGAAVDLNFAGNQIFGCATVSACISKASGTNNATNIDGGYVTNADGTLNFVPGTVTNLVLQSQFAASWGNFQSSKTLAATTAPDGTATGVKLSSTSTGTTNATMFQSVSFTSGSIITYSFYAKSADYTFADLSVSSGGNFLNYFFNLATGANTANNNALGSAFITPVANPAIDAGNGWYRLSITFVTSGITSASFEVHLSSSSSDNFPNITGNGIYVWGDMVETKPYPTATGPSPYVPTTTTAVTVLPQPRIGTGTGLLVEEARTNVVLQSQAFATTPWADVSNGTGTGTATATNNTVVAPDGTLTGSTIALSARSAVTRNQQISQNITVTAVLYSASAWVKATTAGDIGKIVNIWQANGSTGINVASVTLTAVWQRVPPNGSTVQVAGSNQPFVIGRISQSLGGPPDLTAVSFDAWGAQSELGSFPTSYIPTTTAAVARSADNVSAIGPLLSALQGAALSSVFQFTPTTSVLSGANDVPVGFYANNTPNDNAFINHTGATAGTYNGSSAIMTANSVTLNTTNKIGSSGNGAGRSLVLNNGTVVTDGNSLFGVTVTSAKLSQNGNAVGFGNLIMQRLTVWNTRLSDPTLKGFTQ